MAGRGMNDGDSEWETQTLIRSLRLAAHAHPPAGNVYMWVGRVGMWVEGCRNSAAYIAFSLILAANFSHRTHPQRDAKFIVIIIARVCFELFILIPVKFVV